MPTSSDEALAAAQASLLSALTGRRSPPEGFTEAGVQAMGEILLGKRRRAVARECSALGDELGSSFASLFAEYARAGGTPASADPWVDAGRFIDWLRGRRPLTTRLRASALMLRLRRGLPVRAMWISDERRLVVAYRLPGARVRSFRV